MIRFASLGSGSRGNATLVSVGNTLVLVDCGFSAREAERRLARLDVSPAQIDAILVTHEHSDHVGGVARLARRHRLPVWLTPGTRMAWGEQELPELRLINAHEGIAFRDMHIQPCPVPHDAREPCQFVFSDGAFSLGLLTDVGVVTPHLREQMDGCDALLLESNHDVDMLARSPYPASVRRRVGGQLGHLSNAQAAKFLDSIDAARLQHLVAGHLSDTNNCPDLVRETLAAALDCETHWIGVAAQDAGLDWREIR